MKTEISGSNCPAGARVAIVSDSHGTDYLVASLTARRGPRSYGRSGGCRWQGHQSAGALGTP